MNAAADRLWCCSGWWLVCAILLAGCSTAESVPVEISAVAVGPETFSADGVSWTRQATLSANDEKMLNGFMARHSGIAGSPGMEGTPHVYVSQRGLRRFYWLWSVDDQVHWSCITLGGPRADLREGTGLPW